MKAVSTNAETVSQQRFDIFHKYYDISLDSLAEPSYQLNEIEPTIKPLYIT